MPIQSAAGKPSRVRGALLLLMGQYAGALLLLGQGIVLVPLYLKCIHYNLYGAWLATGQVLAWIGLLDPGVMDLVQRQIAYLLGARNYEKIGSVIGSALVIGFAVASIPTIIGMSVAPFVPTWFNINTSDRAELLTSFRLAALSTSLAMLAFCAGSILDGLQGLAESALVYVFGSFIGIIATVYLLRNGWGLSSIPLGLIARSTTWLIAWSFCAVRVFRRYGAHQITTSLQECRGLLSLSAFTSVGRISQALQANSDAFISGIMLGTSSVPVLVLTGKLLDLARLPADRIAPSLLPGLAHVAGEESQVIFSKVVLNAVSIVLLLVGTATACAIAINQRVMALWVGQAQFGGWYLTMLLAVSATVGVVSSLATQLLFARGVIKGPAISSLITGILRLFLSLLLVRYWGLVAMPIAAVIATMAGWLAYVLYLRRGSRSLQLPSRSGRLLAWLPLAWGLGWTIGHVNWPTSWVGVIECTAITAVVVLALAALVMPRRTVPDMWSAFRPATA